MWTWGENNFGELGQNNRTALSSPVQVGTDTWNSLVMYLSICWRELK